MKGSCAPLVSLLLLAVLGLLGGKDGLVDARGIARRDGNSQFPGPDGFVRHRYPTVVALGNQLYIDGGELSQQTNVTESNSTQSDQTYPSYAGIFTLVHRTPQIRLLTSEQQTQRFP